MLVFYHQTYQLIQFFPKANVKGRTQLFLSYCAAF